jgi:transcriptional regulator with XRE-family HTH domain
MPDEHEAFSSPLRGLRVGADMTQTQLAAAMHDRGFRWHQTTVTRVEAGRQHLTLEEAAALAELFGVPISALAAAGVAS